MSFRAGKLYSHAPRCPSCEARAALTEELARALASAAEGRLEVYRCPASHGWHLRNPKAERNRGPQH